MTDSHSLHNRQSSYGPLAESDTESFLSEMKDSAAYASTYSRKAKVPIQSGLLLSLIQRSNTESTQMFCECRFTENSVYLSVS